MLSDRVQRQIDHLLDRAEEAVGRKDWPLVHENAQAVLDLDPDNKDAGAFLAAAERAIRRATTARRADEALTRDRDLGRPEAPPPPAHPESFCDGRYQVVRFLGEGGKKRVYVAHDMKLDRDVAFALIKTEGLDEEGLLRIKREAQAMGRLGDHPHIVSVLDIGEEDGQPYLVSQLMAGGDVEGLIEKAERHRIPVAQALRIADQVCQGLEHAHSHGIVHRDLKPGNVWLTADGTAKLGDFGLAVALNRTRLTHPGMMVGTVSYMPPEQALGGEVTPRSDLYSLGAMLYELVTGRPPFVGDESVAIITQHLNTPPVSPSWHVPDLPPGLETLVLRLLEKDPGRRPASAGEVRTGLAGLAGANLAAGDWGLGAGARASVPPGTEPRAGSTQHLDTVPQAPSPSPQNPLYRRIFVGREAEVRRLQEAFDSTLSGQGALVAVVGEPGIGKTALCEQLATYVAVRGGRALVGHAYEEGSLSLPYLPFIEALRAYILTRDPEELRRDLGSGADQVAKIVSDIRDRLALPQHPPRGPQPSTDPEEERWRLYDAVLGFLRNASLVQPLVIVLEDLHWADRGTLDLLLHLSRQLQGLRLLLVGTYRDVEVDRAHPLAAALAELRRTSTFARMTLRGLRAPEVQRMLEAIIGQGLPASLAEKVHRQTEGNPLFAQEVARYLGEAGLVAGDEQGGRPVDLTAVTMSIPEGLREVIGKRLSRLSPECNRVLATAAVIGREFALETLRAVAPVDEEALVDALDEAVRVGVLEEEARLGQVRYRYTHAFIRQTLYEELSAPRRILLHQQVARALEQQYGTRLEVHAAELAEHFSHSSDRADLAKAVAYGRTAAGRATEVNAYGEAVAHLERALDVQEVLDPDDRATRCDLLLALGGALGPAGEPQRVYDLVMPEAYSLAEALGDGRRAGRASQLALRALRRSGGPLSRRTPANLIWAERAASAMAAESAERVLAEAVLAEARGDNGDRAERGRSVGLSWQALEMARAGTDPQVLWDAARVVLDAKWWPEQFGDIVQLSHEFGARTAEGVGADICGDVFSFASHYLLAAGERSAAERIVDRIRDLASHSRDPRNLIKVLQHEMVLATLDGDFDRVLAIGMQVAAQGEELGSPVFGLLARARGICPALCYLGQYGEAIAAYDAAFGLAGTRFTPDATRRALCAFYSGPDPRAGETLVSSLETMRGVMTENPLGVEMVRQIEVAVALRNRDAARDLLPHVRGLAGLSAGAMSPDFAAVAGRHLGAAAAMLGDPAAARDFYEAACEGTGRKGNRPEYALSRLALAELLLDQEQGTTEITTVTRNRAPDTQAEAIAHLDFAIQEFRAMRMQPSLERALRHKGLLTA